MTLQSADNQPSNHEEVAVSMQNVTISYGNAAAVRDVFCGYTKWKSNSFDWAFGLR